MQRSLFLTIFRFGFLPRVEKDNGKPEKIYQIQTIGNVSVSLIVVTKIQYSRSIALQLIIWYENTEKKWKRDNVRAVEIIPPQHNELSAFKPSTDTNQNVMIETNRLSPYNIFRR